MAGLTPEKVRPFLGDFERKHYTNPTLMRDALDRLVEGGRLKGYRYEVRSDGGPGAAQSPWVSFGLLRIQWGGPWLDAGVPIAARYRQTHWVGAATIEGRFGVWDVNAMANRSGWIALSDWTDTIVPAITRATPRADGTWSITHAIEIER